MATTDESLQRRARALELHLAGASYDTIATQVGYASKSGAHKAVQEALTALGSPAPVGEALETELARLDAMLTGLWPKARRGDVQAVDRVLKIGERRGQLLALADQGAEPEVKGTPLDELARRRAVDGGAGTEGAVRTRRRADRLI